MYGTVNTLCARLLQRHNADEMISLIIWTKEDVLAVLDDDSVTEAQAAEILAQIEGIDGYHEYGVGEETLRAMLENVRESARAEREVRVTAGTLERIARLAGEYIRREEAEGGEGAARRHFPLELDALEAVRKLVM
ncbi:hypothetical protein WB66_22635 [bacteria symbiont BFo1 of Frankliniella occidentalis]|nr:hypothetical protein AI28_00875 [bacteria symbiont BFo1 of Frankliniella occidentalis]KYP82548.1 hypothetical protein WB66_22635 [bacteria symbiont BFo1 of Frankliniella occidentalis]